MSRPRNRRKILNQIEMPGGVEQAAQKLAEARRSDPKAVVFPETIVNLVGYEHLQAGDNKGALEIMKLNVTAFWLHNLARILHETIAGDTAGRPRDAETDEPEASRKAGRATGGGAEARVAALAP
jgi:hypothetical protein